MTKERITFEQLRSDLLSINQETTLTIEMLCLDTRCRTSITTSVRSLDAKTTDMLFFWQVGQSISIAPCDYVTKTINDRTYYDIDYDTLRVTIWIED